MARRTRRTRRTTRSRSSYAPRRTYSRRASSRGRTTRRSQQTVRIVLEQAPANTVARPAIVDGKLQAANDNSPPKRSMFSTWFMVGLMASTLALIG